MAYFGAVVANPNIWSKHWKNVSFNDSIPPLIWKKLAGKGPPTGKVQGLSTGDIEPLFIVGKTGSVGGLPLCVGNV